MIEHAQSGKREKKSSCEDELFQHSCVVKLTDDDAMGNIVDIVIVNYRDLNNRKTLISPRNLSLSVNRERTGNGESPTVALRFAS